MTQFIAHTDEPKTFAHKKGATAAVKRDLAKHSDAHGMILYETGFDVQPSNDRFGVVIYVDLTSKTAHDIVGPELAGYVIDAQLKDEPVKTETKTAAPIETKTAEPTVVADKPTKRRNDVNIAPSGAALIPARYGSTQQDIIDMLTRDAGASLDQLVAACVRKDGKNWSPASLMAGLYHHIPYKGYGVRTVFNDADVAFYHIVLPDGIDAAAAARRPRAAQTLIDRIRAWTVEHAGKALDLDALNDSQLLAKFKNVTAAKEYVAQLEAI